MKLFKILSVLLFLITGCNQKNALTFNEIESPAGEKSSLPRLYTDETGTTFLSWMEENENHAQLKYSSFDGSSWEDAKVIAQDSSWFLNWADYPSIISTNGSPLAAHWLNKKPGGTYAYDVNISTYVNGSWTSAFKPHHDETPTEHGFASMVPMSDSTFLAVWLDGRETEVRDHHEYSNIEQAMTLRGAVIHKNGSILEKYLIDESVCDCCNTSLTKTTDGGFLLVYRNRTNEEIRDIYSTKFKNGVWTKPKLIHQDNWNIAACPVNGPSVSSDNNVTAVAWFTGANDIPAVKLSISNDNGDTFSEAIPLDLQKTVGRVDVDVENEKVYVSWLSSEDKGNLLKIAVYSASGEHLQAHEVPGITTERRGGFPEMEVIGEKILVAYTEILENGKRVKIVELDS